MRKQTDVEPTRTVSKFVLICLFVTLILSGTPPKTFGAQEEATYKNLEIFANLLSVLKNNYVEEIDPEEVILGAIKGMLASLDPHSSYLKPENYKDLQAETKGSFSGIGIEISMKDGVLIVVSPIEGTPAEESGIMAGDKIIKIGEEYTKELSLMEAVKLLRGEEGTAVTISTYREGWSELKELTITRALIPMHSVKSRVLEPGYGYIRISTFQEKTTKDTQVALENLTKENKLQGLVLDLRNNPGGLLDQAVKVSDIFLDNGIIVSTKGRLENQNMEFKAHAILKENHFPIIVLVNEGSASASEIVAGALQDQKRAMLLGTKTFGKGSVQTVIPMNNGAALKLTTARYYTPNGTSIQAEGITPDFIVERSISPKKSPKKTTTFFREKDLKNHISKGNTDESSESNPEEEIEEKSTKLAKQVPIDNQLDTALMLLKGVNIFTKYD